MAREHKFERWVFVGDERPWQITAGQVCVCVFENFQMHETTLILVCPRACRT